LLGRTIAHKRHGIERIFRKQLSPTEDDSDESDGIQEVGDEPGNWALSQLRDHNRRAQGSEPHGDSTSQA
jgi:hypothetical protein